MPHSDNQWFVGSPLTLERIGDISEDSNGYSVTFLSDILKNYDKTGFSSYNAAIAYEQNILDAHLHEKFAV